MDGRNVAGIVVLALGMILSAALGTSESQPPTEGPAVGGSPAWFLQGSFADPTGRTIVDPGGHVTIAPRIGGGRADGNAVVAAPRTPAVGETPACKRSPLCGNRLGRTRQTLQRVQWKQTMGYTFTYPYALPPGFGGVPAVALDSKGNLWAFQRADVGKRQLFKFDPNDRLVLQVGQDVIGYQDKAHGMAVDAEDNVWITAANGATVMKISPEGKLLLTIGERGRRGDWNSDIAFAPNSDVYIGEGHANESPNDTDSDDPANNLGAARIIHLDKNGKFIGQWYGNDVGQGDRPDRCIPDDLHGMDARCARHPDERHAYLADDSKMARRLDRLLARCHARRRHDELPARYAQSRFWSAPARRGTIHEG
jgi:hypothetical protein